MHSQEETTLGLTSFDNPSLVVHSRKEASVLLEEHYLTTRCDNADRANRAGQE